MAHGDVKHDYHLVNPSPWPFVGSVGALVGAVGAVVLMRGIAEGAELDFEAVALLRRRRRRGAAEPLPRLARLRLGALRALPKVCRINSA